MGVAGAAGCALMLAGVVLHFRVGQGAID